MIFELPAVEKAPIELLHFPTRHQAFIFRAYEYVPAKKIAQILKTTEENVHRAAQDMGLKYHIADEAWLKKGYITLIKRMWHVLPYSQLFELLDVDEPTLATILREEDFLSIKLQKKPFIEPVYWRELTPDEEALTKRVRDSIKDIDTFGVKPFDFKYDVPEIKFSGSEVIKTRMIYLFSGLYLTAFDVDSRIYCPDEILEAYQKLGINGIWTQAVLSQLVEFPFAPQISKGYEQRIERMRDFTSRLKKYGIKLFLYINEPRSMPNAFFEKFPHLKGHSSSDGNSCLCVSVPEVQEYLKNSLASLCRQVPELGGFFTITRSENLTNCYSHSGRNNVECNCPRCKDKSVAEIISTVMRCFAEGVHSVNADMKVFAWSWAWGDDNIDIIRRLPKDVILLSQSELQVPYEIGGVKGNVRDYSMSIIGPGERAKSEFAAARECGIEIGAKVQVNTTWEASTVPALPVFPSIEEHMRKLKSENVEHLLLSWTLGGYPSRNIACAAKYFYEKCTFDAKVSQAEKDFAEAFKEFPFELAVLYRGPQNAGPSNMLFVKPTGYNATMTCFAYDDLQAWHGNYPTPVFEDQFRRLCEKWKIGLNKLTDTASETYVMAQAAYCLFKSSLNQIRFIRARDEKRYADAVEAARCELEITKKMLELMNKNASIGFEAANHYYFSKGQLLEKIVNCNYVIDYFKNQK